MSPETAHLGQALAMARMVNDKAAALLAPLEREMKVMAWPAEFRAIMWEAVKLAADERQEAAEAQS